MHQLLLRYRTTTQKKSSVNTTSYIGTAQQNDKPLHDR